MECNKFFHFSTGGIIDVNAKIVLINTIPFRTTKFVRNVNLNYYCHLFIINSNSQWCNILALFILIYISFSKRKKKKKERKQLSFQPLGCENQILYTLKYPLMSSTLSIIRMRGGREKFYYTFVANSATLVVSVYQRITADTSPDKTGVDNRYLFWGRRGRRHSCRFTTEQLRSCRSPANRL